MELEKVVDRADPVVPLIDALSELVPRLWWSREQLLAHQGSALTAAIRRAITQSPFHRRRLAGVDFGSVVPHDLSALPTMTKGDLMANWDDVVTANGLTLQDARAYLKRVDTDGFRQLAGQYIVLTSGGSTGEPGVFAWSLDELARFGASSFRWSADATWPTERPVWIGARSPRHPSALAPLLTGSDHVPIDQPIAAIVERLNDIQPDAISTLCSMLPLLIEESFRGRLRVQLKRLDVFGDVLDPDAATLARQAFGVSPIEGYPTTDVGYIAQQAPGEPGLYLNDDLLLIEVVDEFDRPVAPGVAADHILVTSLHQHTTPLIRYRIDDRVVVDREPGRYRAYRRLAAIDGRCDEVFVYGDLAIHPHVLRTAIGGHLEVHDYEITQTEHGVTVRIVGASSPEQTEVLRRDIALGLDGAGLTAPAVEVLAVERIPRTGIGKRRRFVPIKT